MLHANNCFIVLLDFDNFINSLFCNYFNYFDLVMRASSLLAFRCYFELSSINKDFTSLHFTSLHFSLRFGLSDSRFVPSPIRVHHQFFLAKNFQAMTRSAKVS